MKASATQGVSLMDRLRAGVPKIRVAVTDGAENVIPGKGGFGGSRTSTATLPTPQATSSTVPSALFSKESGSNSRFSSRPSAVPSRKPLATIAASVPREMKSTADIALNAEAACGAKRSRDDSTNNLHNNMLGASLLNAAGGFVVLPACNILGTVEADQENKLDDSMCSTISSMYSDYTSEKTQRGQLRRRKSRAPTRADCDALPEPTSQFIPHISILEPAVSQSSTAASLDTVSSEAIAEFDEPGDKLDLRDLDVAHFPTALHADSGPLRDQGLQNTESTVASFNSFGSASFLADNAAATIVFNTQPQAPVESLISQQSADVAVKPSARMQRGTGKTSNKHSVTFTTDLRKLSASNAASATPAPKTRTQSSLLAPGPAECPIPALSPSEVLSLARAEEGAAQAVAVWSRVASADLRKSIIAFTQQFSSTRSTIARTLELAFALLLRQGSEQGGVAPAAPFEPFLNVLRGLIDAESIACRDALQVNTDNLLRNDEKNRACLQGKVTAPKLDGSGVNHRSFGPATPQPVTPQRDVKAKDRVNVKKTVRFATADLTGIEGAPTDMSSVFLSLAKPGELYKSHLRYKSDGGIDSGVVACILSEVASHSRRFKESLASSKQSVHVTEVFTACLQALSAISVCSSPAVFDELMRRAAASSSADVAAVAINHELRLSWHDVCASAGHLEAQLRCLLSPLPTHLPFHRRLGECISSAIRFHLRQAFNAHIYDQHFEKHANAVKALKTDVDLASSRHSHPEAPQELLAKTQLCGGVGKGGGAIQGGYIAIDDKGSLKFNESDLAAAVHSALYRLHAYRQATLDLIAPHTLKDMNSGLPVHGDTFATISQRNLTVTQLVDRGSIESLCYVAQFISAHRFLQSLLQMSAVIDAVRGDGTAWRNLRMFARMIDANGLAAEAYLVPLRAIPTLTVQLEEEAEGIERIYACVHATLQRHLKAYTAESEKRKREDDGAEDDDNAVEIIAQTSSLKDADSTGASRPKKRQRRVSKTSAAVEQEDVTVCSTVASPLGKALTIDAKQAPQRGQVLVFMSPSPALKARTQPAVASSPAMSPLANTFRSMLLHDSGAAASSTQYQQPIQFGFASFAQSAPTPRREQLSDFADVFDSKCNFEPPKLRMARCSLDCREDVPDNHNINDITLLHAPASVLRSTSAYSAPLHPPVASTTLHTIETTTSTSTTTTTTVASSAAQQSHVSFAPMRVAPKPAARQRGSRMSLHAQLTEDIITAPKLARDGEFSPCKLFADAFETSTSHSSVNSLQFSAVGGAVDMFGVSNSGNVCGECLGPVALFNSSNVISCFVCSRSFHMACLGLPAGFHEYADDDYKCPKCARR